MAKRLVKALGVLVAALLLVGLFALPALAEPKDEPYTINPNGTITFDNGSYPTASKVTFDMPEGASISGIPYEIYEEGMRNAFAVEVAEDAYDYYCWPDAASIFFVNVPDGYYLDGATVTPASAGEAWTDPFDLYVKLSAPATVTVSIKENTLDRVDVDPATGVSVAISSVDVPYLDEAGATLSVSEVTDEFELEKTHKAVLENFDYWYGSDGLDADELLTYDVLYTDSEGYPLTYLSYYGYVTIPIPESWGVDSENYLDSVYVFQYFEMEGEDGIEGEANELLFRLSADGTGAEIRCNELGRFVVLHAVGGSGQTKISGAKIASIGTQYYTGTAVTPELSVTYDGVPLVEGVDYAVTFYNNDGTGPALAKVSGMGAFKGNKYKLFWISKPSVADAQIAPIESQAYTGSAVEPKPRVTFGDATLVEGTDYTLTYKKNVDVGTATVKVSGQGYYKGSQTVEFSIVVKTGWQLEEGRWHFYDEDGMRLADGWATYGGKYYYFGADGELLQEGWVSYQGKWYYIKGYVPMKSGVVQYAGKYYYIEDYNPVVSRWVYSGGYWYHFNSAGVYDQRVKA